MQYAANLEDLNIFPMQNVKYVLEFSINLSLKILIIQN